MGGVTTYETSVALQLNTWSHLTVVHGKASASIFVNGKSVVTVGSGSFTPEPLASPVYIGRRSDAQYFDGKIDDVRIYNNALTWGNKTGTWRI